MMTDEELEDREVEREREREERYRKEMVVAFTGMSKDLQREIALRVAVSLSTTAERYQFYRSCAFVADMVWLAERAQK